MDLFQGFFSSLPSLFNVSFWERVIPVLKVFAALLSFALGFGIFVVFFRISALARPRLKVRQALSKEPLSIVSEKEKLRAEWEKIVDRIESGLEQDAALAIIEADNLIDYILKKIGYAGSSLADRLKQIRPDELHALNDLWNAHKLRNNIVHTPGFKLSFKEAHNALKNYKKALEELDAI